MQHLTREQLRRQRNREKALAAIKRSRLSDRAVGRLAGVASTNLSRMRQGAGITDETLAKIKSGIELSKHETSTPV